jgi:hypothetical protein
MHDVTPSPVLGDALTVKLVFSPQKFGNFAIDGAQLASGKIHSYVPHGSLLSIKLKHSPKLEHIRAERQRIHNTNARCRRERVTIDNLDQFPSNQIQALHWKLLLQR